MQRLRGLCQASPALLELTVLPRTYEAIAITAARAEDVLPAGWEIAGISAIAFQRELHEQVAEEVVGWERPDWV
jgi:hypothetical protein